MLDKHNEYRALHVGTDPLQYDAQLAADALVWSTHLADIEDLVHANSGDGENLAWSSNPNASDTWSTTAWYEEICLYDYADPGFGFDTGHFTQAIWVGTTHIGCARVDNASGNYVTCRYSPPGNWSGQYETNVQPLIDSDSLAC